MLKLLPSAKQIQLDKKQGNNIIKQLKKKQES